MQIIINNTCYLSLNLKILYENTIFHNKNSSYLVKLRLEEANIFMNTNLLIFERGLLQNKNPCTILC